MAAAELALQRLATNLGVTPRRLQATMTQKLRDKAHFHTGLQQMGSAGVTELMWVEGKPQALPVAG